MSRIGRRPLHDSRRLLVVDNLDDRRWHTVQTRDARASDIFVYGVSTTSIFCRPGCASRQPLRQNVEFFATPIEALDAGYRACLRCRPDQTQVTDPSLVAVIALCRLLERADDRVDVSAFAAEFGYSERHLRRRFSEVLGISIASYVRSQHVDRVRRMLRTRVPVTQAIYEAGFGSNRAFYEHAAPRLGMSPGTYQAGAAGERISFTSLSTPMGVIVAACTERGVCAVRIGPDESVLHEELAAEFPHAILERDDVGLLELARCLAGAVRGESDATRLPLDLAGTAFQMRVWEALRDVPSGSTLTYSQLAARIGAPRAARAVGSACAANPTALVVPCHRVVRRDGSLGGYRWGLELKERLLEVEGGRRHPSNK